MSTIIFNYSSANESLLNDSLLWDILNEDFLASTDSYDSASAVVLVALYIPVFILGIFGNGFLTFIILSKKQLRNLTNLFLCSLAAADLAGEHTFVVVQYSVNVQEKWFKTVCL